MLNYSLRKPIREGSERHDAAVNRGIDCRRRKYRHDQRTLNLHPAAYGWIASHEYGKHGKEDPRSTVLANGRNAAAKTKSVSRRSRSWFSGASKIESRNEAAISRFMDCGDKLSRSFPSQARHRRSVSASHLRWGPSVIRRRRECQEARVRRVAEKSLMTCQRHF